MKSYYPDMLRHSPVLDEDMLTLKSSPVLHLLSWPHPNLSRHTLDQGHSARGYRTQVLSDHFRTGNRSVSARILLKLQFLLTKPLRDVDNPGNCHDHSEIPDSWPPVTEILDYQARVRARVGELLSERHEANREGVGRALWLGFEHEGERT